MNTLFRNLVRFVWLLALYLGVIPTPRGAISVAFGGPDKHTLFVLARGARDASGREVANAAQVYAIQMIAQGYKGRAK